MRELRVEDADAASRAKQVKLALKARRSREDFFSERLFADPAWDILLELYGADLSQKRASVTGLGQAGGVPPTTNLRWINTLDREGLIVRQDDRLDGRRVWVSLSEKGRAAMNSYFDQILGSPLL